MATPEQRSALLAVACPWCGARPGVACRVAGPGRTYRGDEDDIEVARRRLRHRPIRTLDGASHGARWEAARLGEPVVVVEALSEYREPAMAGGVPERPW